MRAATAAKKAADQAAEDIAEEPVPDAEDVKNAGDIPFSQYNSACPGEVVRKGSDGFNLQFTGREISIDFVLNFVKLPEVKTTRVINALLDILRDRQDTGEVRTV